jgi:hypothetical protein
MPGKVVATGRAVAAGALPRSAVNMMRVAVTPGRRLTAASTAACNRSAATLSMPSTDSTSPTLPSSLTTIPAARPLPTISPPRGSEISRNAAATLSFNATSRSFVRGAGQRQSRALAIPASRPYIGHSTPMTRLGILDAGTE